MADTLAGIAPQKNTYANWVTLNPTLGKDADSKSYSQFLFATGSPVGDILIWGNNETFTVAYAAEQFVIQGNDDKNIIGSEKKFFTSKDRIAQGYLAYDYNNAVSQTTYADLYTEVGDIFEKMHTDAGDAASGAGNFYPTPLPGYYDKSGVPDSDTVDATSDVDDTTELITLTTANYNALKFSRAVIGTGADGIPIRVKLVSGALPTGLAIDTTYFVRFKTTPDIELYTTEAYAINTAATTGRIDLTDAVGTFQITQEGIALDDAGYGHEHSTSSYTRNSDQSDVANGLAGPGGPNTAATVDIPDTDGIITDGVNGTPRITNETRGRELITFNYIKALKV